MERLINITQASRLTGRSRNTIRAWIKTGKLPSVQRDGVSYITPVDFNRMFPDVPADAIEKELTDGNNRPFNPTAQPAPQRVVNSEQSDQYIDQSDLHTKIERLEERVAFQEKLIANLTDTINDLRADKRALNELITTLTGRLLPLKSSSPASNQPRDKGGRFATKKPGDGVGALFQQASLVPDDNQD